MCGNSHVQFHENLIFAGQQVKEVFAILPLCPTCHAIEKRRDIKEKLDWMMLCRASYTELKRYSKVENLIAKRDRLIMKYGVYLEEDFELTFSEK